MKGRASPSGTDHQSDLRDHLVKKQRQTSQEGGLDPSQAKSLGAIPKVKEGVGCQGGYQSSGLYNWTN